MNEKQAGMDLKNNNFLLKWAYSNKQQNVENF